ncbi:MAG: group 1 glycosyl transferase [Butyrivibrio sp.]|nr:group 1 glycosyl transferase [Butyrivibrio sp.]
MTESRLIPKLQKKNVVFITVKNRDYIRVSQIERLISENAEKFAVYTSEKKNPFTRALDLNHRLRCGDISFSGADVIILGFLPQLIWKSVFNRLGEKGGKRPEVISDFFLSLYDTMVLDRKLIPEKSLSAGILKKLDKRALEGSDLVLTDTKADALFFAKTYGVPLSKFDTLYLEADERLYSSKGQGMAKKEALYFGTGLPLQGTEVVLDAFMKATEQDADLSCVYIGGTGKIPAGKLTGIRQNPRIELIEWLSQEELAQRIAGTGVCLAGHFAPDIDKADRTIPGKAYIFEAMGKPMILGETRANRELFSEDERHFFVPRGDSEKLAECILKSF